VQSEPGVLLFCVAHIANNQPLREGNNLKVLSFIYEEKMKFVVILSLNVDI
jgi:trehalose-6-phosphate synthase